jgi:hypothetical protein
MKKKPLKKKINKYQFAGPKSTTDYSLGYNAIGLSATPVLSEEDRAVAEASLGRVLTETEEIEIASKKAQEASVERKKQTQNQAITKGAGSLVKAAQSDASKGILGKFMVPKPVDAGQASLAASQPFGAAPGVAPVADSGSSILSSTVGPTPTAQVFDASAAGAGKAASTTSTVASTAASTVPQMSGLASAGIGIGANIAGTVIENRADDDNPYTFTKKESRGNVGGSMLKSAGTGFSIGAAAGSILPGVGNVIGGIIGAGIGAGVGAIKAGKENKEAKKEAERLKEEKTRIAGDYNSAFLRSRLAGPQTGFGYASSTNMDMQSTPSFYAQLGGAKQLPGGYEIPIGPNGEVKYIGNTHDEGGIMEGPLTEVENNETKDTVLMKKGGKVQSKEYFFSEYLKLGGKSFAKIHEGMVKSGASQEQIQALAEKQEKIAGRNPKQIAAYGGVRKYQTAGENKTATVIKEGATETKDKLIGAKDPKLLPQFENAKKNPIWAPENYETWKNEVNTALNDEDTAAEVAKYIETYAASTDPFAEQVKLRAAGKTGADLVKIIRKEATDNDPGIFHEAVRLAIENAKLKDEPKKEDVKVEDVKNETPAIPPAPELPEKYQACPPGQYRDRNGNCVAMPKGEINEGMDKGLLFGALQMVPAGYALLNPYKPAAPIAVGPGPASVKGAVLPRVNMNQERASATQLTQGIKTAIQNQNAGPGGIAAMMATNSKLNDQMLQIADQEQKANLGLAAEEARLGQQASQFNVEAGLKSDAMRADIAQFNKQVEIGEKQYKREERLGALEAGVRGATGIYRDQLQYKAQDRLARAVDETGSYDRFNFVEKALKDRKKKTSPYYGLTEDEILNIAAEKYPVNIVAPQPKPKEEKQKGGVKKYVSRLGQLKYNKTKV